MNIDLSSKNHLTKFSNSYHPVSSIDSVNVPTESGKNIPSSVEEFQDGKEFSTPKISTNLLLGEEIRATGEFPFLEEFHNNDSKIVS